MKITLKNFELLNTYLNMKELMKTKLPVKTGWNLSKNAITIERLLKTIQEIESNLIDMYAEKDTDGNAIYINANNVKLKEKCKKTYNEEYQELMDCENELDLLTIKLEDLIYTKNENGEQILRELEPSILHSLSQLIDDSE